MGRRITHSGGQSHGRPVKPRFRSLKIDVQTFAKTGHMQTAADIVKATAANEPLVGRTQIDDPGGKLRYVLEYPIKTMNFQPKTNSFQVDTGPLLVPDFDSKEQQPVDRLEMAHVAYNQLDRAEFILRRPTTVKDDDKRPLCDVLHYSKVREDRAQNAIFAAR